MIAPAAMLALTLVQAPVVCDWANRPSGKIYACAAPDNKNAIVAFVCDAKTQTLGQIYFTLVTGKQGLSGKMSVKNGAKEQLIPMLGIRVGMNGFASPAVPEVFEAVRKLVESANGPLTFAPVDTPDVAPVSIDGAAIANGLKASAAGCKGL